jgi:L-Lysine epsilon oxidase N-terminal/L-lysine epsilon oxidase C-terminal domain
MPDLSSITRAAIHPSIGIARLGDSPEGFFIGPELPSPPPVPEGGYKDASGFLKRQAARFRIYGYDASGKVVAELTADNAEVEWTVHVANKKAAWYQFEVALDIPEAASLSFPRRNANITGDDRRRLIIDPGPRPIAGRNRSGRQYYFDSGKFMDLPVYLGELRTDEAGRLLFLGGRGSSSSATPNNTLMDFANNDGWHDDTSDGPVTATVSVNGKVIPVDPAWVVTAPPNYAPDIVSVVTMHDVMVDTYQGLWMSPPETVSFQEHILPIFEQFCQAQWVNYGFHVQFGWDGPNDFMRLSYLEKLSSNEPQYSEFRRQLFNIFRNPDYKVKDIHAWPLIYGDNMNVPGTDARQFLTITDSQYGLLRRWKDGDFDADWDRDRVAPSALADVPVQRQPSTLDRASLHFCLGGAFHPGCEMTWPMRHISLYYAPFRLRLRYPGNPEPDYGDAMTQAIINQTDGPLSASGPGDITRWMAVPWQTDTASCRAGYEPEFDPYLPTFWPARVPNHVLSDKHYQVVMNEDLPIEDRMLAFNTRSTWVRVLTGSILDQVNQMVTDFSKLGVVERRPGPGNDPSFPSVMQVESIPGKCADVPWDRNTIVGLVRERRHLGKGN